MARRVENLSPSLRDPNPELLGRPALGAPRSDEVDGGHDQRNDYQPPSLLDGSEYHDADADYSAPKPPLHP